MTKKFGSSANAMDMPCAEEFEILQAAILCVGGEPDARVRSTDYDNGLFIKLERTFIDLDFLVWPPLTICLTGLLKTRPYGSKMLIRYRELAHHNATVNSSVNHDYIFELFDGQLVEFSQSICGAPELPEPKQQILSNHAMDQADQGAKILKANLGINLEISTGDCGILFDRIMQFTN